MANSTEIQKLLQQYTIGKLSASEEELLIQCMNDPEKTEMIKDVLTDLITANQSQADLSINDNKARVETILVMDKNIGEISHPVHRVHFLKTAWFRYAAAIILLLGVTAIWYKISYPPHLSFLQGISHASASGDIAPGTNKAILILADGSTIVLDNATNGQLAQQGNAAIVKLNNGQIAYNLRGVAEGEVMVNTMATPAGGQYQIILPDGTKVWLNAASSITYPTAFAGNGREVKISGEVYFEVAKNKKQPFIVDVAGKSTVQVLGTSFNINSYENENSIRTTLIEGSVKVSSVILKPGQQAVIGSSDLQLKTDARNISVNSSIDIDKVMAWKNGYFSMQDESFAGFMRKVERWYDVQVRYEGKIPEINFQGRMDRGVPLSIIIQYLKSLNIDCRIENRLLIISK